MSKEKPLIDYTLTAEDARNHKNIIVFDHEEAEKRLNRNFEMIIDKINEHGEKVKSERVDFVDNDTVDCMAKLQDIVCPIPWYKKGSTFSEELDEKAIDKFFSNNGLRIYVLKGVLKQGFKITLKYGVTIKGAFFAYYITSWK